MTEIQERLIEVQDTLPEGVKLVAVSKFHPLSALLEAYDAGQRIFGESRVQELQQKQPHMPSDVQWHFIGHLQVNKVKYIAPYISLIHAVDSFKLLKEIDRQAERFAQDRASKGLTPQIHVLLQLHVAQEETKYGFTPAECKAFLDSADWRSLKNVVIAGIMCMASNVDDEGQIAAEFATAQEFFEMASDRYFRDNPDFNLCSWGMSGDYPIAVEHGANLVRVGSYIFGERNYDLPSTSEAQQFLDEGLQHAQHSEWGKAISCFKRALTLDPDSPAAAHLEMLNSILDYYHKDNFNP